MDSIFTRKDLENWAGKTDVYFLQLLNGEASLKETREDLLSFRDIRYFLDGDSMCAVREDFVNLQESVAGFGDDKDTAKKDLIARELILCESNYMAPLNSRSK